MMKPLTPRLILMVYIFLLLGLGVSTFVTMSSPLPSPTDKQRVEELKKTISDPDLAKLYGEALSEMKERQRRLVDVSMNGLSTVLGALIGFLSASWAGGVRNSKTGDTKKKPAAEQIVAGEPR